MSRRCGSLFICVWIIFNVNSTYGYLTVVRKLLGKFLRSMLRWLLLCSAMAQPVVYWSAESLYDFMQQEDTKVFFDITFILRVINWQFYSGSCSQGPGNCTRTRFCWFMFSSGCWRRLICYTDRIPWLPDKTSSEMGNPWLGTATSIAKVQGSIRQIRIDWFRAGILSKHLRIHCTIWYS